MSCLAVGEQQSGPLGQAVSAFSYLTQLTKGEEVERLLGKVKLNGELNAIKFTFNACTNKSDADAAIITKVIGIESTDW